MKHFSRMRSGGLDQACPVPAPSAALDKWQLLAALEDCGQDYGLGYRELGVLRALVSLFAERDLSRLDQSVVFPSNETLAQRLDGMPVSTMRRHLSRLVASGLVGRRLSPNGKRYARRDRTGTVIRAFGFDLAPLVAAAPGILARAEDARDLACTLAARRETLSLLRRDLECDPTEAGLELAARIRQLLRRRLRGPAALAAVEALITEAVAMPGPCGQPVAPTPELSTTAREIEQHHQKSQEDIIFEKTAENAEPSGPSTRCPMPCPAPGSEVGPMQRAAARRDPVLTPASIVGICTEALSFYPDAGDSWRALETRAGQIAAMIGLSPQLLAAGRAEMGREVLATTVLCLLQCHARIRNPGGYLSRLIAEARAGTYRCDGFLASLAAQAGGARAA
ncbi:plasmid replication protein RepC [Frigidibacter sp. MR17.24]|uniref:plasmid replication protein RepC n=1 Tax=Frigidibacter sp. MR17.24 TaxID=3127345 RepID=UPI003012A59C